MILAVRDEPGAQLPERSLPALRVEGLSFTECAELARGLGADISASALRSLVELTGGNPLAVLENLAGAADGMDAFDPGRLALGASLERAWGRVFDELPQDTRHALFVVVEAAAALFVSRKTVEAHLTRAYRKLGVRSRTELACLLLARGGPGW